MTKKWRVGIVPQSAANPFNAQTIAFCDKEMFDNEEAARREASRRHAAKPFICYVPWPEDGVWPPTKIYPDGSVKPVLTPNP